MKTTTIILLFFSVTTFNYGQDSTLNYQMLEQSFEQADVVLLGEIIAEDGSVNEIGVISCIYGIDVKKVFKGNPRTVTDSHLEIDSSGLSERKVDLIYLYKNEADFELLNALAELDNVGTGEKYYFNKYINQNKFKINSQLIFFLKKNKEIKLKYGNQEGEVFNLLKREKIELDGLLRRTEKRDQEVYFEPSNQLIKVLEKYKK